MSTKALAKTSSPMISSMFDDFFRPWNEWFENSGGSVWGRSLTVPAVNIIENKDDYKVSLAVPGMKKDDFRIDVEGNMLTISSEFEEKKEEEEKKFTRMEYNYSSFSRSFTIPDEVNKEKIEASYKDGLLILSLPKKEEAKKLIASKHIAVK
jgi:HSP20 family protein